jgi:hypothetical protein
MVMPIKILDKKMVADFNGNGDIVGKITKGEKGWGLSLRNCSEGEIGRTINDEENVDDESEIILNFSNPESISIIIYLLEHMADILGGARTKLSKHVGKTKDGDLIRVFKTVGGYEVEIGGKIEELYDDFEKAHRAARKEMIWSYLPQLDESEVEGLINSGLEIKYKWKWMK